MDVTSPEFWQTALIAFGIVAGTLVIIVVTLLVTAWQQVQDLNIPQDADFFETLQVLPITVPIALDLLDLAFDTFSAPITWVLLELMGLRALQMITIIEGIIPGTGVIPTMTISWFVARGMKRKKEPVDSEFRNQLRGFQGASRGQYGRLGPGGRRDALSAAQRYRGQDLLGSGQPDPLGGTDPLGGASPRPRTRIPSGGIGAGGVVEGDIIDGEFLGEGEDDFDGDYSEEERF